MNRSAADSIFLVLMFLFSSCKGPMETNISITGRPDMNSGGNPVMVRVYQLNDAVGLTSVTVDDFWTDEMKVLGPALIKKEEELRLYPDQKKEIPLVIEKGVQQILVATYMREADPNKWYMVFPVSDLKNKQLLVSINKSTISVDAME